MTVPRAARGIGESERPANVAQFTQSLLSWKTP